MLYESGASSAKVRALQLPQVAFPAGVCVYVCVYVCVCWRPVKVHLCIEMAKSISARCIHRLCSIAFFPDMRAHAVYMLLAHPRSLFQALPLRPSNQKRPWWADC
jgi:hypothetical protein